MAIKAKRHTHKYHRVNLSFGYVWACALPDCNHYMPQHMTGLVLGKNSICWLCDESFVLNGRSMKDDQPYCEDCRVEDNENLSEIMKKIDSKDVNSN